MASEEPGFQAAFVSVKKTNWEERAAPQMRQSNSRTPNKDTEFRRFLAG
jgi:hypothetical protein